jgi:predicted ester cyclase
MGPNCEGREWFIKGLGIPPTGNKVSVTGISIFAVTDGKIVEMWDNMDCLGMFQLLGVIPSLGEGEG